jgi:acetolactate synthase I/III small subunit
MQMPACETQLSDQSQSQYAMLELTVNNHPGVMAHICGLFSRRAFNVEGILCLPIDSGQQSRVWLLVSEDQRLQQMMKQLRKLEDVLDVQRRSAERALFVQLERFFWPSVTV